MLEFVNDVWLIKHRFTSLLYILISHWFFLAFWPAVCAAAHSYNAAANRRPIWIANMKYVCKAYMILEHVYLDCTVCDVVIKTDTSWAKKLLVPRLTRNSAVTERPRDASCHWIFCYVVKFTQGHSKYHCWVGRVCKSLLVFHWNMSTLWVITRMLGLPDGEKNFEDMCNRLATIPACGRHTDGHLATT